MPDEMPRFCIFGDSHYACLRQAERLGLVDTSGLEVEHWGHVGGRFLFLEVRDGVIHPKDDFTAMRFARFNEKARTCLPARDFDSILVMGARCYMLFPFQMILRAGFHGPFMSEALQQRIIQDNLRKQVGYKLALGLAESGTAKVMLAPTSFPTVGLPKGGPALTPEMMTAGPELRSAIWALAAKAAAQDGITLIPQPEETVTQGMSTSADFAVDRHAELNDYAHRNAAYGALILAQAVRIARSVPRRT
jgi:hypothetical protein